MPETIKSVFEKHCGHIKFDSVLAKKIHSFQVGFANKNEDHMTFFAGHLTGVQVVRFTTQDRDAWFTDVLGIDDLALEEALHNLPSIDTNRIVTSSVFNQATTWLIHKFLNSPLLDDATKHKAMIDCAMVLYYRYLTSLLYKYFVYPANPQVAEATYAQLSYKYELKQQGNWHATLMTRCEKLIDKNGIHGKTFKRYDSDFDINYLISDSQGRIRDMLKNIYSEFMKVHSQGIKIKTTSTLIEHDGEMALRDTTKGLSAYSRYLHSIITDEHSFVKDELIDLIDRMMKTMPPKLLKTTLKWCSTNQKFTPNKDVTELIDLTLVHSFGYLTNNRTILKETNDLALLISKLKGVYMSSRSVDGDLMMMREKARIIVKQATGSKNESLVASIRTGLLLYIVLRAFTMNHYSSK